MSLYKKISAYITINKIIRGFFIAFLSAGAMYLDWLGFVNYFINTILGLLTFYYLLQADRKVWFWTGFFIGTLWFWWISMSFANYGFAWAIPIGILFTSSVFGLLFMTIAIAGEFFSQKFHETLVAYIIKIIGLLIFSYVHPFAFDWFKPELVFTNSYIGIEKWQFALVLSAIALTLYKKKILYLLLILGAYPYAMHWNQPSPLQKNIELSNFHITVQDKWKQELQQKHIYMVFKEIDRAISLQKETIVLPESIFALFLNNQSKLMESLLQRSKKINIVLGSLYWDKGIPRNSAYIFKQGEYFIANKVVLVPFGEFNPLPQWLGDIINKIFYDGAPDYVASTFPTDYQLEGVSYRNAICYEACSEELYQGHPQNMIAISNNGWVSPSIEPTQQKIIFQYYSKKYGTTIYHSVNMSQSYIVHNGEVLQKGHSNANK